MREPLLLVVLWTLVWASPTAAQEPVAPLSQNQLIEALKAGGLSAGELSGFIRRRGLNFEMSADLETRFREAGADTDIVLALWEKELWNPPQGAALTKDFLTALLQSGTPLQRLSKWIVARKVNFELSPGTKEDLKSAGASEPMIELLKNNNLWVPPPPPPPPPPTVTYEQIMTNAREALKGGKYDVAENSANAAKLMDASRPEAFSLIGYVYLYHFGSFPKAATEYRSAIGKGGDVEFRVLRVDHVSKLGKVETSVGQLVLKKGSLVFRSSSSNDNLALSGQQIVEARLGGPSAKNPMAKEAVHVLTSQDVDRPVIFHAARGKNKKDEEKIIAELINLIRQ